MQIKKKRPGLTCSKKQFLKVISEDMFYPLSYTSSRKHSPKGKYHHRAGHQFNKIILNQKKKIVVITI